MLTRRKYCVQRYSSTRGQHITWKVRLDPHHTRNQCQVGPQHRPHVPYRVGKPSELFEQKHWDEAPQCVMPAQIRSPHTTYTHIQDVTRNSTGHGPTTWQHGSIPAQTHEVVTVLSQNSPVLSGWFGKIARYTPAPPTAVLASSASFFAPANRGVANVGPSDAMVATSTRPSTQTQLGVGVKTKVSEMTPNIVQSVKILGASAGPESVRPWQ